MSHRTSALLNTAQVADILRVHVVTLVRWRRRNHGPQWVEVAPRTIRYRPEDVERWIAARSERVAA